MGSLVVLPTYNEASNGVPISRSVLAQDPDLEVLIVDDNSPDGTADLVERAGRDEPRLHLLRRPAKLGLGSAYLAGFRDGLDRSYGRILTMDCDGSHDPSHLPDMLAASRRCERISIISGSAQRPITKQVLNPAGKWA